MLGLGKIYGSTFAGQAIYENNTLKTKKHTSKKDYFGKLNDIIDSDKKKIDAKYKKLKTRVMGER